MILTKSLDTDKNPAESGRRSFPSLAIKWYFAAMCVWQYSKCWPRTNFTVRVRHSQLQSFERFFKILFNQICLNVEMFHQMFAANNSINICLIINVWKHPTDFYLLIKVQSFQRFMGFLKDFCDWKICTSSLCLICKVHFNLQLQTGSSAKSTTPIQLLRNYCSRRFECLISDFLDPSRLFSKL